MPMRDRRFFEKNGAENLRFPTFVRHYGTAAVRETGRKGSERSRPDLQPEVHRTKRFEKARETIQKWIGVCMTIRKKGIAAGFLFSLLLSAVPHAFALDSNTITLPANSTGEDIQKALDQLPDGGEVVLPAGTFRVSEPIILRHDHQTLRGAGFSSVLLLADDANCPVVVLGSPIQPRAQATSDLHLTDLFIDGNRTKQTSEFWRSARDGSMINNNGVAIWDVTDATIERVTCCHCRSGGLVMAETRRIAIQNFSAFDNEYDGLACYSTEDCKFSDLNLRDNLAAGLSLDLSFNHNIIACATMSGNDLGVFMRDSRNNLFQSVTIDRSHRYGVFMAQTAEPGPAGWRLIPGTECTDNTFNAPVITNCGSYGILINNASCTNNVVHDAQFANNAGNLLQMDEKFATSVQ
jgi:hypothetical protein